MKYLVIKKAQVGETEVMVDHEFKELQDCLYYIKECCCAKNIKSVEIKYIEDEQS